MPLNRRDILKFAGGSALGLVFSPVPWKLLDDSSIWTQNWSWTPRIPRGDLTTRFTNCTLCPAACGVKARCVGGLPFALAGVSHHPTGRGVLCAAGLAGHYIAYHPDRVRHVLDHGKPSTLPKAIEALRSAKGPLAILDERPGRAISDVYREFLAGGRGMYLTPGPREEATFEKIRTLVDAGSAFGIDLERTRTVLSFGAPLLDGWGGPGRVWAARDNLRLIQAEPRESRTASLADVWLPIRPGTEAALALGIAHILLRDKLTHPDAVRAVDFVAYRALVERCTPDLTAKVTGLSADRLLETAREFAAGSPSVALGGGDVAGGPLGDEEELAIAGLNLLVGSVGRHGGFMPRSGRLERGGKPLSEVADGSLGALVIDAAAGNGTPWEAIQRKLAPGAVVVSLATFADAAGKADFLVPSPAYLESIADVTSPFDAPCAMFAVAQPLLTPLRGTVDPNAFVAALAVAFGAASPASVEDVIKRRAAAIHAAKRGSVFSYATLEAKPLASVASPEEFWKALTEGACWIDDEPAEAPPRKFRLLGDGAERLAAIASGRTALTSDLPLALLPHGWNLGASVTQSPMATKLYQESGLRPAANETVLAPETARANGLEDGVEAIIETARGSRKTRVRISKSAMPGAIEAPIAPQGGGLLDLCQAQGGARRVSPAKIRRA